MKGTERYFLRIMLIMLCLVAQAASASRDEVLQFGQQIMANCKQYFSSAAAVLLLWCVWYARGFGGRV